MSGNVESREKNSWFNNAKPAIIIMIIFLSIFINPFLPSCLAFFEQARYFSDQFCC